MRANRKTVIWNEAVWIDVRRESEEDRAHERDLRAWARART